MKLKLYFTASFMKKAHCLKAKLLNWLATLSGHSWNF